MKAGLTILAILTIFLSSCTKSNNSPAPAASFQWTYINSVHEADSSAAYSYGMADMPIIVCWDRGWTFGSTKISITVSSFDVGTYNLGGGSKNNLYFVDYERNETVCQSGTLNITGNTGHRLSGNFTATMVNIYDELENIKGSFTNIPVKP